MENIDAFPAVNGLAQKISQLQQNNDQHDGNSNVNVINPDIVACNTIIDACYQLLRLIIGSNKILLKVSDLIEERIFRENFARVTVKILIRRKI